MRIAIVNDTLMCVVALQRVIESSDKLSIAWVAKDGMEAVQACEKDTPDLILMDIVMPEMDGVEATRQIMHNSPCAILVVTSTITGNSSKVFEAMGAGALDVISTPILEQENSSKMGEALLNKINMIGQLISFDYKKQSSSTKPLEKQDKTTTLIAIGSSTGGPSAIVDILGNLPDNFPAAFVVIQHIDKQFVHDFVKWLNDQTSLPVRLACDGDKVEAGTILVANSEQHLMITKQQTLTYSPEPETYPYRPSVNVFFDSIALNRLENAIGILLTGMGKDGATGLLSMQQRGFTTIAQKESSCAVYGMPKEAIKLNAANLILSPVEINKKLKQNFFIMKQFLPINT